MAEWPLRVGLSGRQPGPIAMDEIVNQLWLLFLCYGVYNSE